MKGSEYRIGNYVLEKKVNGDFFLSEVHSIMNINGNETHVNISKDADGCWEYASIEPIPITMEWLTSFGFDGSILYLPMKNPISLSFDDNMQLRISAGEYVDGDLPVLKHIKYVHQLQNLHFDLCRIELRIKDICTCGCHKIGSGIIMHFGPCCKFTGEKYINEDWSINYELYNRIIQTPSSQQTT